jgi:tetratricopeptide (TPR) repeat protein
MGLNTSVQQFVERQRLNDLNRYLLYFPEEYSKQLDQDEIIEILDQAKARDPEWHEAMLNANIDIFEMTYEESVSYFKRLENLEKIRRTNGPNPSSLPVDNDNKKTVSDTSSVGKSSKNHKGTCGATILTKNHNTADCKAIAKFKQQKKNKACFEAKAGPRKKSLAFFVLFEDINAPKGR